jgi:crossover junction endodeoxyribonuclease RuvC
MRILGIDPGSQITGFGVVEKQGDHLVHVDNGGIFTRSKDLFAQKLHTIFKGINELIERYAPSAVAIENIFYAKNVRSTIQLGHARGAAMVAVVQRDLEVFEYTPLTIKQALVGYGRASKEQIQTMVKHLLKLPETTYFDASDALAVAICHLHSVKYSEKIKKISGGRS